jgi:hypothetical protein
VGVLEFGIGATAAAQLQHEARGAGMEIAEAPVALDTGDVVARETMAFGIERVEHVTEFVEARDLRPARGLR